MRRKLKSVDRGLRWIRPLRQGDWRLFTFDEWPLIGAAPKGYLAFGNPEDPNTTGYIAKGPKNCGAQECITEEIISQIGRMLPLKVARSRLVRLPGADGRHDDVRFMSENFLERGREALVHGAEVVARYLEVTRDELETTFDLGVPAEERRFYSIDGVIYVLKNTARTDEEARDLLAGFGRMIAFDALVGAPDRHALNWGVIEDIRDPTRPLRFAPLFDTARGLFWQHRESQLEQAIEGGTPEEFIQKYAERSRPVFSCPSLPEGQNANHFQLVEDCLERYDTDVGAAIRHMVQSFSVRRTDAMLRFRIGRMISPLRRRFIIALLRYRHRRLQEIIKDLGGAAG